MYTRPLCQGKCKFLRENPHSTGPPPHTMACQGTLPWEPRLGQGTGQGAGGTEKTREPGTLRGRRRPHATGSPELGSMAGSTDAPRPPPLHANGAGAAAALQAPWARPVTRLVAGVWRCSAVSECLPKKLPAPRAPGRGWGVSEHGRRKSPSACFFELAGCSFPWKHRARKGRLSFMGAGGSP